MNAEVFLDTNILLYAISTEPDEASKAEQARELMANSDFGLSTQVLQEFFHAATRKIKRPLSDDEAGRFLTQFARRPVVTMDVPMILRAVQAKKRHQLSYWDGAIVAAAQALGAKTLYSEDLNNGQFYGSVQVINPFLASQPAKH